MKKLLSIAILALMVLAARAQDPFVTQRFNTPLFVNPAQAGTGEKANRLAFLYRDQWRSVPVPYVSTFLQYDRRIIDRNGHHFGGGVMFFFDQSGDGALRTFHPSLLLSYGHYFNERRQFLSAGVRVGYLQRVIDRNRLTFDNQYGPGGFDPTLGTGESFGGNAGVPDLGAGIHFTTLMGEQSKFYTGFAVYDPHQPDISFDPVTTDPRPVRYTAYASAEIFVHPDWSLTPSAHFQSQRKAREIHTSLFFTNYTSLGDLPFEWSLGGGYRHRDAAFAYTGFKMADVHLGFSYDINTSAFNDATQRKGGFEISLTYEFERRKEQPLIDTIYRDTLDTLIVRDTMIEEPAPDTSVVVDTTSVEPPVPPAGPVEPKEIVQIRSMLPVRLYFDNDRPDPDTYNTRTEVDYDAAYREYLARKTVYARQVGTEAADSWFGEVTASRRQLDTLAMLVRTMIEEGAAVKITMKGYTSPLAASQYNTMLSMRRIESVKLFLREFEGGVLAPFLDDRTITIVENPFGEAFTPFGVSDDAGNRRASVYGRPASYERRVEVIAVEILP